MDQTGKAAAEARVDALIRVAREFGQQGWTPATSGNYSVRTGENRLMMTRSGVHKRDLDRDGLMPVDLIGQPIEGGRPSAETGLHTQLYRHFPGVNAVLHVHSPAATVASRMFQAQGRIELSDYEMLKAFAGITTHATTVTVPVLPNEQNIASLAASVEPWLADGRASWVYLIAGHGLYAWGPEVADAARHVEALEFLLACHLLEQRVNAA